MREYLLRVTCDTPPFVCGAIVVDGRIAECAPLLRAWMDLRKHPHREESARTFVKVARWRGAVVEIRPSG